MDGGGERLTSAAKLEVAAQARYYESRGQADGARPPFCVVAISKAQIDRLGDRLRKGEFSETDLRQLDAYRRSFAGAYEEVLGAIRNAVKLEPTTGRPAKSTTSIVEKLRRETIRLSQMQDIAGCRLVVQEILAQDRVVEQLKEALAKAGSDSVWDLWYRV